MREDLTVLLTGADALTYRRCLRDIYEAVAAKQVLSRGAVDNLANTAFATILRKGMSLPKQSPEFQSFCGNEIRNLRKALEREPATWEVIGHACGIDKDGLPTKFGKVTFVVGTTSVLDGIPEPTITRVATREHFAGRVLSRVLVQAIDVDAARAAATVILQQTNDCLNFFAAVASISGQAYLPGERATGHGFNVNIDSNNNVVHGSFLYGPIQPLP